MAMDEQGRKISKPAFEEHQEKTKKRKTSRRRRDEEGKTELPLSHGQAISADDAVALQKRKEKKARKLLLLQEQDANTRFDRLAKPFCDDHKKATSALKVGELEDQHFGSVNLHRRTDQEEHLQEVKLHREIVNEDVRMMKKKKSKKKKKKREIKFVSACGIQEAAESPRQANAMNNNSDMDAMNSNSDMDSRQEKDREKKGEKKRKRVTFQEQISEAGQEQVTDILDKGQSENSKETVEEVWGVRFTPQEDEILKDAVWTYIKSKGWDEQEGLNKVFNSIHHKDARNCWADINMSLPHRPRATVRFRARILLEKGAHLGKWSKEEEELLKRLQGEHGRKWREISSLLNRHRTSLKEKWRTLKRPGGKGGWTQGELQQLSDMVHRSLRVQALLEVENKNPTHQHLRYNINWEKIADTIGTHSHGSCCSKWYNNLQSALVTDGHWKNEDDGLLLKSLLESEACTEEEVEWDSLLDHRSGQLCSMRWKQMSKHLGENRTRQFVDKLDILARRYAPELLETSVDDASNKENPSGSPKISS